MHRAHAWHVLPLLSGATAPANAPSDLQDAVRTLLGAGSTITANEVLRSEVGIIAHSWDELSRAVWLIRAPDAGAVDRWFPAERRSARGRDSEARTFRMDNGLIVCERSGVIAVARRWEGDMILLDTMYLMRGRKGPVLEDFPAYQELMSYLPERPLATAYVVQGLLPGWASAPEKLPGHRLDRLLLALFEGEGGIDLVVRGVFSEPVPSRRLEPRVVDRLLQLPRSTLAAVATPISSTPEGGDPGTPSPVLDRYVRFLAGLAPPRSERGSGAARVGENMILAWDQDLAEGPATPQAALLIQAADAPALVEAASAIADRLMELLENIDPGGGASRLAVEQGTHLGTPFRWVHLKPYAEHSRQPFAKMLTNLEPCWAASGDWFIVALTRNHLERILGAERGLVPSLAGANESASLRRPRADLRVAALVQGESAVDVLDEWVRRAERAEPSLLNPRWWEGLVATSDNPGHRLGIGMRSQQAPGVVVVARVQAGSAADGVLEADDRILGVDGRLLDLENPNLDLRRRLHESRVLGGPTLRVSRGEQIMDLVLPIGEASAALPRLGMTPSKAVRELADLLRSIPFATLAVHSGDPKNLAARLSLRFTSESTVTQIPAE